MQLATYMFFLCYLRYFCAALFEGPCCPTPLSAFTHCRLFLPKYDHFLVDFSLHFIECAETAIFF